MTDTDRYRRALEEIRDHWATSYDHRYANTEAYRGPYGVGVVDGHRACAIIARRALEAECALCGNPLDHPDHKAHLEENR
jgi:hypothetical protein